MKQNNNSSMLFGAGSLVIATFLYACFGVFSRMIGTSLPLFYQNATRSLLAPLFIAIILTIRKNWSRISSQDLFWIFIRSFFGIGATATFVYTVLYIPISTFYFIFYAGSVFGGYLFGKLLLQDKITKEKIIAFIIAAIGLGFIFSFPSGKQESKFLILSLISGLCVSLFNILSAKISSKNSALLISLVDNLMTVPIYILLSLGTHEPWTLPTYGIVWGANLLFSIAMVGTGALIVYGFRRLDSQIGSLIMLTEIVFASLFGFFLYQERLQTTTLLGGLCIIGAILFTQLYTKNSHEK